MAKERYKPRRNTGSGTGRTGGINKMHESRSRSKTPSQQLREALDEYTRLESFEEMLKNLPAGVLIESNETKSAATKLIDLATEVLEGVCVVMPTKDIKSLRLVCQRLHKIASKFVLAAVYVDLLPESFERLLEISNHPVLSLYVRTLWYNPQPFKSYGSIVAFQQRCAKSIVWGNPLVKDIAPASTSAESRVTQVIYSGDKAACPVDELRSFLAAHQIKDREDLERRSEQEWESQYKEFEYQCRVSRRLLSSSKIYYIMSQACIRFPKLQSLVFGHTPDVATHPWLTTTFMRNVCRKTFLPPQKDMSGPAVVHSVSFLRAAGLAGVKVRSLRLGLLFHSFFCKPISHDIRIRSALAQLSSLRISMHLPCRPSYKWNEEFGKFLQLCPQLQTFELLFMGKLSVISHSRHSFLRNGLLLLNLRALYLMGLALNESELSNFMAIRHLTLSRVDLRHCWLEVGGSWTSLHHKVVSYYPHCIEDDDGRTFLTRIC